MKKTSILFSACFALSGCAETEWTEGFLTGGFQAGYTTKVKYEIGGPTTLRVALESEVYREIVYPVSMEVLLNEKSCSRATAQEAGGPLLLSAVCSSDLGPGLHVYKVVISNPNTFGNFTKERDQQLNSITGSITYTIEENL